MPFEIVLKYRRDGETYSGSIMVPHGLSAGTEEFSSENYARMMRRVHLALVTLPDAELVLERADTRVTLPIRLKRDLRLLLLNDPSRFIKLHSPAPVVLNLFGKTSSRKSKLVESYTVPMRSRLRVGHDTLADALGDVIYLKLRTGRIEHPITGRWVTLRDFESELRLHVQELMNVEGNISGWVTVKTAELLQLDTPRFFLPRAWNVPGPWIAKEALQKKYDEFVEGRSKCLEQ